MYMLFYASTPISIVLDEIKKAHYSRLQVSTKTPFFEGVVQFLLTTNK